MLLSLSKYGVNGNCYLLLAAIKEFNVAAIDGWLVTERERFGSLRYGTDKFLWLRLSFVWSMPVSMTVVNITPNNNSIIIIIKYHPNQHHPSATDPVAVRPSIRQAVVFNLLRKLICFLCELSSVIAMTQISLLVVTLIVFQRVFFVCDSDWYLL